MHLIERIESHVSKLQHIYIWPIIIVAWLYGSGQVAKALNNGKAPEDDPSSIYGFALQMVPVFNALLGVALFSGFLNNSLKREEYVKASWQSQLADNLPELTVFLALLWFFHAHS